MGAYVKSVLWLVGTAALGYTLLLVTAPNDQIIAEKFPETRSKEALQRKQQIVDTIRQASESKTPMYRQTKEEIEAELKKK